MISVNVEGVEVAINIDAELIDGDYTSSSTWTTLMVSDE